MPASPFPNRARPALAAAALLYAALALPANPAPAAEDLAAMRGGDMRKLVVHDAAVAAPDIEYLAADGGQTTLAASNGRVRLVNFWATWCAPCRHEMPGLDALQRALGGPDFEVILIATGPNTPEGIADFFEEVGVTLGTGHDPKSELARAMGVPGLPVTVLLDREGNEVGRLMGGAEWDTEDARAIINALVEAP